MAKTVAMMGDYLRKTQQSMGKLKLFLNSQNIYFYLVILTVFYGIASIGELSHYEWNPTAFFRFGHYYILQNPDLTPDNTIRLIGNEANGGNGYDGQIFYYFASSLSHINHWPNGFSMAYRAPRIGLPLINGLFGFLGNDWLVYGFIFMQFGLVFAGTVFLYKYLNSDSKYLTVFFILSPFLLRSTMLMVSDGTTIALAIIGLYYLDKIQIQKYYAIPAYLLFSLSLLAKESALFILFPLGLYALWKRDLLRIFLIAATLLPLIAWQYYLRMHHGMVPANILKIFVAPMNGIFGVLSESIKIIIESQNILEAIKLSLKISARVVLIFILGSGLYATVHGDWKKNWQFRLMALFTMTSIIFADYFYFWGIFDNVARMFGILVPAMIWIKNTNKSARTTPFFLSMTILGLMIIFRSLWITPAYPYDIYSKYTGPAHTPDPARPGILYNQK